ncbi:MAG: ankyrin repeat domain-containing protein [Rickettsiales bacterium]|nr:ankyrin repeat domain-containing protein [Rickettsiales bacterium]
MKIKQNFKNLKKPDEIEQEALQNYLKTLYGDPNYEVKDASYVEDTEPQLDEGYKRRANILLDELLRISDNPKFEQLRPALTENVSPGEMRGIADEVKRTAEVICYRTENGLVASPEKFQAEIKSATIDACTPGALTNMQKIVHSMDDSLYNAKYEYIQNLATEYARNHISYSSGNEVHVANELIHEVSKEYNVYPPKDIHARYRDLSSPPSRKFKKNAKFKDYLNDTLNTREGIYSLVESFANNYLSRLPDTPKLGFLPVKEGDINSPALEQISSIAASLGIGSDGIIEYNDDYTKFKYKDNYQDAIQLAITHRFMQEGFIDQQALEYNKVTLMAEHSKFVRNTYGKFVQEKIPAHNIERKVTVIEAPNSWYVTSQKNDCLTIEEKLFSSMKLKGLTKNRQNLEDYLHEQLADRMELGLENALRTVIEEDEEKIDLEQPDIIKELTLLSDQIKDLQKYLTKEELSSLSNDDLNKWIEFSKSPDKSEFIAKFDNGLMLEKHLKSENITYPDFQRKNFSFPKTIIENSNIELISYLATNLTQEEASYIKPFINGSMQVAMEKENLETIEKLVKLGADINFEDAKDRSPLDFAAQNGHVEAIGKLVELGADINFQGRFENGPTALHYAALSGHVEAITKLVDLGADINLQEKIDGATALHSAARNGHVEAITKLVNLGADINLQNERKKTPLHIAADNGDVETIKELVKLNADPNTKNEYGLTALHFAAHYGHVEAIKELANLKADINLQDEDGKTALHHAAAKEKVEAVGKLVELGADINAKNKEGKSALDYIIQFVRSNSDQSNEWKTALNTKDKDGLTLLHYAAKKEDLETIEKLVELGADPNAKNKHGTTALHYAATKGEAKAIKDLVDLGADINDQNDHKMTALHYAVVNKKIESIGELLELDADPNIKNNKGKTALESLSPELHNELVNHLAKTDKNKLPKIINNFATQTKDNPHAWKLIEETIAAINPKDRPLIVLAALNKINNTSHEKRLLKLLPKEDKAKAAVHADKNLLQELGNILNLYGGMETSSNMTPPRSIQKTNLAKNKTRN